MQWQSAGGRVLQMVQRMVSCLQHARAAHACKLGGALRAVDQAQSFRVTVGCLEASWRRALEQQICSAMMGTCSSALCKRNHLR